MDNQPRQPEDMTIWLSRAHDADRHLRTALLSAKILIKMAEELGRGNEVAWLRDEAGMLSNMINRKMWDEKTGFYYDIFRDGSLSGIKTVGAYWTLLAGVVPDDRIARFVAHLDNEAEFKRTHRIPSLSADNANYREDGGYWRGSIWAPTNYMVLKGLEVYGFHSLAYEIACNHLENVVSVFNETGTLWENYAPESAVPGKPAKRDFVGWTGLVPTAVLLNMCPHSSDAVRNHIEWRINRTEKHGNAVSPRSGTVDPISRRDGLKRKTGSYIKERYSGNCRYNLGRRKQQSVTLIFGKRRLMMAKVTDIEEHEFKPVSKAGHEFVVYSRSSLPYGPQHLHRYIMSCT